MPHLYQNQLVVLIGMEVIVLRPHVHKYRQLVVLIEPNIYKYHLIMVVVVVVVVEIGLDIRMYQLVGLTEMKLVL